MVKNLNNQIHFLKNVVYLKTFYLGKSNGLRFYSTNSGLFKLDKNKNYVSKNRLNKLNKSKIYDYLDNVDLHDDNLNNIKLLESRLSSEFIINYKLIVSIHNIAYMDEDLTSNLYNWFNNDNINFNEDKFKNILEFKFKFEKILKSLEDDKIYKIIFRWCSVEVDEFGNYRSIFNTSPSFFIYKDMDIKILLYKFIYNLNIISNKYTLSETISIDFFIKEWISVEEFQSFDEIINVVKKSNNKFKQEKLNKDIKLKSLFSGSRGYFDDDLNSKKFNLGFNIKGLNYGDLLNKDEIVKLDLFNKLNISKDINSVKFYKQIIDEKIYLVKVENLDINIKKVQIYLGNMLCQENKNNLNIYLNIENWKDIIDNVNGDIIVNRISDNSGHHIKFINNELLNIDVYYKNKKLLPSYRDLENDCNIGVIDIETYNNDKNEAIPYSIGFKTESQLYSTYIDNYSNSDDMILDCINNLFINKNHNIKLYAHNMSEFDGIIILKSLIKTSDKHDYNINIFSNNEGKIISIDIIKKIKNKKILKISILDSYLILPVNLNTLAKVFKTAVNKGIFPYGFINKNSLGYKGVTPDFKYFNNLSYEEYLEYVNSFREYNWDVKEETLKYLEKDLLSLYEVIMEFNNIIYRTFYVNITRVRTLSGLAFLIYTSKYYDEKNTPIYYTKGKLEKFIRESYVGGIVDVMTNYTDYLTYKYDVNSHYPNAMLQPMPGGVPRISSEKNLENIFGFVEAIVEAPSEKELKVAILPIKKDGSTILFRNTEKGVFFSEELKMAVSYGYKVHNILSCVQFDKVIGTFDNYIKDIYFLKSKAEKENNKVNRYIFKLLLNNLYGRLGLKQLNCKLSLVKDPNLEKLLHTENSEILFKYKDLNLVKSSGPIDPELTRIINDEKLYDNKYDQFNSPNPWGANKSSVQYCAAITAYARMYLNQFKNNKENIYLGGDTDSIIMSKPLDKKFVGNELGQFKLEFVIKEAFYHSKKFYLLKTIDNNIIIKAKGIDNKNNILNYDSFVELFKGNNITIRQIQFIKDFKTLNITIQNLDKTIKGINNYEINQKMKNRKLSS